jgi:hypothetical protein
MSCKKETQNVYLQQEEVSLVQPRIEVSNTIIDSFVTLVANSGTKGTEIYYTTDKSEPISSSLKYVAPLKIFEPGVYNFKSFLPNWKPSQAATITFYKMGHQPTEIIWYTKLNEKYKGQGPLTLINQKKASLSYGNPEWVGFDSVAIAKVVFNEKTMVKTIDIGFLSDPQSWIFPPYEITIYPNDSKNNSDKIITLVDGLNGMVPRAMKNINIKINKEVNSLRIEMTNLERIPDWHEGAGNKAWLFMDEWIFN